MSEYQDFVMLLTFLVNLLLLLGTNRLMGFPPGARRCAAAAALGSAYSGLCLLPRLAFLGNPIWRLMSLVLMAAMAFGVNLQALRRTGVFGVLNMAVGALAMHFGRGDFMPLLCCGSLLWTLCHIGFEPGSSGKQYEPVTIQYGPKRVSMLALQDSGHGLRDPLTGEQVLVVSSHIAQKLTGLTREQLSRPLETMTQRPFPGLRLIPYQTIGNNGMLLGRRFSNVNYRGKKQSAVVAFAAEDFGKGEVYQALTGGI